MMPAGDRSVDSSWWAVRLNALRVMQLLDEFELAALDFCVTFEVSPPAWVSARCNFQVHKSTQSPAFANTEPAAFNAGHASSAGFSQAATVPMPLDETQSNALALNGEVLGDATALLSGMRGSVHSGERIIVSCVHLVRVDFSAAGSILNWVAARQSEGCQVQFRDVQRLVAAFFNVIGITEHARVIPKAL
jgi:ABC-type transporter Mla MlaB component